MTEGRPDFVVCHDLWSVRRVALASPYTITRQSSSVANHNCKGTATLSGVLLVSFKSLNWQLIGVVERLGYRRVAQAVMTVYKHVTKDCHFQGIDIFGSPERQTRVDRSNPLPCHLESSSPSGHDFPSVTDRRRVIPPTLIEVSPQAVKSGSSKTLYLVTYCLLRYTIL